MCLQENHVNTVLTLKIRAQFWEIFYEGNKRHFSVFTSIPSKHLEEKRILLLMGTISKDTRELNSHALRIETA